MHALQLIELVVEVGEWRMCHDRTIGHISLGGLEPMISKMLVLELGH